jgi:hypothetical protein
MESTDYTDYTDSKKRQQQQQKKKKRRTQITPIQGLHRWRETRLPMRSWADAIMGDSPKADGRHSVGLGRSPVVTLPRLPLQICVVP